MELDWLLSKSVTPTYHDGDGNPLRILEGLGTVNVFVGANSAGKSRMLRALFTAGNVGLALKASTFTRELSARLPLLQEKVRNLYAPDSGVTDIGGVRPDTLENLFVPEHLRADIDTLKPIRDASELLKKAKRAAFGIRSATRTNFDSNQAIATLQSVGNELSGLVAGIPEAVPHLAKLSSTYVPVLRSLRPLGTGQPMLNRTQRDYFDGQPEATGRLYSGESLYGELRSMLLGTHVERQLVRNFETFLSRVLFQDDEVELIPRATDDVVWVRLGSREERPIYDLGDGIQHAIILTFPMFTRPETFFFVEEPELHLHPGLQRKILEAFQESRTTAGFERNRLFMTTHSNHFLDMSLDFRDVAVYRFAERRDADTLRHTVVRVSNTDNATLEVLGVRKSSVLLTNATIWVEGISERWFFRRLIELHQAEKPAPERVAEDLHYSFVEYGGTNIVHYAFIEGAEGRPIEAEFLCGNALVIADWDGGSKAKRLEKLEATHGSNRTIIIKEVREVENLLSPEIVRKVVADYERCSVEEIPMIAFSDYQARYLGAFLDELLGEKRRRRGGYSDGKTGTVRDKVAFWKKALAYLDAATYQRLPNVTRNLAARIHGFIVSHNT